MSRRGMITGHYGSVGRADLGHSVTLQSLLLGVTLSAGNASPGGRETGRLERSFGAGG